jgi:putative endonuclease
VHRQADCEGQRPRPANPVTHPPATGSAGSPGRRKPSRPRSRWLVYLLRCRDGSLYTGITNDLPRRLKTHAAGKASRYTRSRLPVQLAYTEPQPSKSRSLKREAAIKKLTRRQKESLLGGKVG